MHQLSYFNLVVLILTAVSISFVLYYSGTIMTSTPEQNKQLFGVVLTEEQLQFKGWSWSGMPIFIAGAMNMFEGN